ncbi:conserved hypothetical protein [Paecilomyces variotii No. 5]|uniref:U3 small nucleolar RNA-associated protein 22 n=1 Tax=Byssochlamys spectabilis (strain No. 5 / NBRC 109023) TaxID=1356009 RepID=V5FPA1_BYSSN|nr:conserved hypothetical protein [Paecilomyces variotii No. 5]
MSVHSAKRRKLSPSDSDESDSGDNNNTLSNSRKTQHNGASTSSHTGVKKAQKDRSAELALSSGLYKSNVFKLQMDDLLADLRLDYDREVSQIQEALSKIKKIIEQIPGRPAKSVKEAEKEIKSSHGVVVPFPEPRPGKETKYTMAYAKPANINVVGSFALRTGMKTADPYTVDLAVTMPDDLFQEKDYVNYRYFHKRAYYVACIATGLKSAKGLEWSVKFEYQDGDSLRPVIVLRHHDDSASQMPRIRIITAINQTVFPISKTLPAKNNIRKGDTTGELNESSGESTPYYNAALRSEATVTPYLKFLHAATQKSDSFRDACILGHTWLRQRGFGPSPQAGGLGTFEWAVIVATLMETGGPNGKAVLLPSYSSYQIFKAMMQFFSNRDLTQPIILSADPISIPSEGPVIYDGKRGLNVLYKMTPWSYNLLRHEARITLAMLNETRYDNFGNAFIVKVHEPMLRFDRVLSLPLPSNVNGILSSLKYQTLLFQVLSRALGDRANLIALSSRDSEPWAVGSSSKNNSKKTVLVGILLESKNAHRVIDQGPSAEQKEEAASFREFWGEKSELRRFKDGSIVETLVWSDQPSAPSIVHQILAYVLQRHFELAEESLTYIGDEYDRILDNWGGSLTSSNKLFQLVLDAFNSLERSLRDMADVPLTIKQLLPASPLLRHTALEMRPDGGVNSGIVDVVLQFESSTRWPDDLAATQMTKLAFLVKIGDYLESSGEAASCRTGLENESTKLLNNGFLDIVHKSHVTFRLRIHHDREQALLENQLKSKTLAPRAKEETADALAMYKRLFIQGPRLTQALRTLCTRVPALSPTIRVMKQWFSSHLLVPHINEEFIELLTARAFLHPYPWETPSSVMTGFLRTLYFLSRWNWKQEPLIVDINESLTADTLESIRTRFAAWRKIDPAMNSVVFFAASGIDQDGITWTQYEMPSKVVAARISALAKAAVTLVRDKGADLDAAELFRPSLAPYDFVVELDPKRVANGRSGNLVKFKNLQELGASENHKSSAAIRSFVQEIQASFGNSMLLFHGDGQCRRIAGLWNPQMKKPRGLALKLAYSTMPSNDNSEDNVTINTTGILNEIARLGEGLVRTIHIQDGEHKQ